VRPQRGRALAQVRRRSSFQVGRRDEAWNRRTVHGSGCGESELRNGPLVIHWGRDDSSRAAMARG
jgi:hypothetical protein